MKDLIYVLLTIFFLAASWGFILFCDRLMQGRKK